MSLAAPATTTPAAAGPKECKLLSDADVKGQTFGRDRFIEINDLKFVSPFTLSGGGASVSATFNTGIVNGIEAEVKGNGLIFSPATFKYEPEFSMKPQKYSITYHIDSTEHLVHVENLSGEPCIVPNSQTWTKVDSILLESPRSRPILDCQETTINGEKPSNAFQWYDNKMDGTNWSPDISVTGDVMHRVQAVVLDFIHLQGSFITQDPALRKTDKIAVTYQTADGKTETTHVIANKQRFKPIKVFTPLGKPYYRTGGNDFGFCKLKGSDNWSKIVSVAFVV
ncbi:hypothetical protein CBS101457_005476 [Exobasidium rhododendri]|nr:hypothetical protein CBS101457_005476 [Exobasidium rhododendri]